MKTQNLVKKRIVLTRYIKIATEQNGDVCKFKILKETIRNGINSSVEALPIKYFEESEGFAWGSFLVLKDEANATKSQSFFVDYWDGDCMILVYNPVVKILEIFCSNETADACVRVEKAYSTGRLKKQMEILKKPTAL